MVGVLSYHQKEKSDMGAELPRGASNLPLSYLFPTELLLIRLSGD
jgi:hypothetical protein